MKRIFMFFVLCLSVIAVVAQKPVSVGADVRHVSNKFIVDGNQLFYNLPKNVIRFEVKVKEIAQFRGPYAFYAKKYLNIQEGVIGENSNYYEIVDVHTQRYSTPDSLQYYSISYDAGNLPSIQVNEDGVLMGCNVSEPMEFYTTNLPAVSDIFPEEDDLYFSDLGVKPFVYEKSETAYKNVATDSTPTRVPYTKKTMVPTSDEENAAYAADQIRKIRKRRAKLLFDQVGETNPKSHETAKVLIEELNAYEQDYLALFVGKTRTTIRSYFFDVTPGENPEFEQKTLCWFSGQLGLRKSRPDSRARDFKPVFVKMNTVGKVPQTEVSLIDNTQKAPVVIKYGLYYRIPGKINIKVDYQNQTLLQKKMDIAQKGVVVPLPVEYLKDNRFAVELHPETGALKRLYNNTTYRSNK